ncbi:trans-sialidase, putative [Trypanosoma cruzi]|nr:trans-sialidase, putative [Trypanosoma cruzi]
MGTAWAEVIGTLSAVWVNARSGVSQKESLRVDALIAATIEERKEGHAVHSERERLGENRATALCLWVTDSNRTFPVGPVAVDNAADWMLASTLLHSDGSLHLLQRRGNCEGRVISLSRLTELSTIYSVLSTWAQKDIFFSSVSTPTAGVVTVLSGASSDDTWNDEYLFLNATVKECSEGQRWVTSDGTCVQGNMAREHSG